MYGVIKKIRQFNLPVTCQLELFDKMVVPVLLYGCEVWGFEKLDSIERVRLKFLKYILCLKSSTPNYMVYGETGRFPLYVIVFTRMVSYWCKLISSTNTSITNILYRYLLIQTENTTSSNPWIDCIRHIFNSCGLSNVWHSQFSNIVNQKWVSKEVKQRLQDQFIQNWHADINNSSKGVTYKIVKSNFEYEKYLDILPLIFRKILVKFRTSNHHLPVKLGRWEGIPFNERFCPLCNTKRIADEFHYILECDAISQVRNKFIDKTFSARPNVLKLSYLMTTCNVKLLRKLFMFITKIYEVVCPP